MQWPVNWQFIISGTIQVPVTWSMLRDTCVMDNSSNNIFVYQFFHSTSAPFCAILHVSSYGNFSLSICVPMWPLFIWECVTHNYMGSVTHVTLIPWPIVLATLSNRDLFYHNRNASWDGIGAIETVGAYHNASCYRSIKTPSDPGCIALLSSWFNADSDIQFSHW